MQLCRWWAHSAGGAACTACAAPHAVLCSHLLVLGDGQPQHGISQRRQPRARAQAIRTGHTGEVREVAELARLPSKAAPHLALVVHRPVEPHNPKARIAAREDEEGGGSWTGLRGGLGACLTRLAGCRPHNTPPTLASLTALPAAAGLPEEGAQRGWKADAAGAHQHAQPVCRQLHQRHRVVAARAEIWAPLHVNGHHGSFAVVE